MNDKATLILDMPKNCFVCPLVVENKDGIWCGAMRYGKDYHMRSHHYCGDEGRPGWCPLKPMPSRSIINDDDEEFMKHYKQGRNDVIAELSGEIMQNYCEELKK